ncbi:hypothetical protein QBC44DRAFT_303300 [Cladorrhinum sp. PSN332]|nr:hypothetical protein QBC44DRAFT_303300 [Cladorrhinum sp. PSN332]
MHLLKSALLLAAAAIANANKVTFVNQDDVARTVLFTPSVDMGCIWLPELQVGPYETVTQNFPFEWQGMWYAIKQGAERKTGMLGEIKFDGFDGLTFFDVSGIDNPTDWHNVKKMYPAEAKTPVSGCDVFWCNNAYWAPHDEQTKATREHHLITTLGDRPQDRREYESRPSTRSIGQKFNKFARAQQGEQVEETVEAKQE